MAPTDVAATRSATTPAANINGSSLRAIVI